MDREIVERLDAIGKTLEDIKAILMREEERNLPMYEVRIPTSGVMHYEINTPIGWDDPLVLVGQIDNGSDDKRQ